MQPVCSRPWRLSIPGPGPPLGNRQPDAGVTGTAPITESAPVNLVHRIDAETFQPGPRTYGWQPRRTPPAVQLRLGAGRRKRLADTGAVTHVVVPRTDVAARTWLWSGCSSAEAQKQANPSPIHVLIPRIVEKSLSTSLSCMPRERETQRELPSHSFLSTIDDAKK